MEKATASFEKKSFKNALAEEKKEPAFSSQCSLPGSVLIFILLKKPLPAQ
jgi:hypothetical protein